jgi:hypothetical protein
MKGNDNFQQDPKYRKCIIDKICNPFVFLEAIYDVIIN